MKKIIIPAFAALLLAGWLASSATAAPAKAPEIYYGAKKKDSKHKEAKNKDADADDEADSSDEDEDDSKSKKKGKKAKKELNLGEAGKALKSVKFFSGRPNLKAKYFIYFQASAENLHSSNMMGDIMTEYKKMKKDGRVEIIYVGHDPSASVAKKFLHQNKAKFPGLLKTDQDAQTLPGFAPSTKLPNVIIIDSDGKVLHKGDGATITTGEWKAKTIDSENDSE